MRLSARLHDDHPHAPYPALYVDDSSLQIVIAELTQQPDISILVPAHSWLHSEVELEKAWDRLLGFAGTQTMLVPLLVCPDDMDFGCEVVVVEQHSTESHISWSRMGYAQDREISQVNWLPCSRPLCFSRENFTGALSDYMELCRWPPY
ncbi:MAG: hypothetical protein ABWY06_23810 [Pseudomonas sp.]|uniref:hypothetical protein n=1 Tax=Pseudomonas sp. TaxID=306 RepID=UPI0033955069